MESLSKGSCYSELEGPSYFKQLGLCLFGCPREGNNRVGVIPQGSGRVLAYFKVSGIFLPLPESSLQTWAQSDPGLFMSHMRYVSQKYASLPTTEILLR